MSAKKLSSKTGSKTLAKAGSKANSKTSTKVEKKTFMIDDQIVTSGGVLLYRFKKNTMELLMVESRGGIEDLGGRIDKSDRSIYTTVAREAFEETNELLDKDSIKKRIKNAPYAYMARSKYIVYIIPANPDEVLLTTDDFGDTEICDNIKRKIKWIPISTFLMPEIIKHKLNWRLKNKALFDIVKKINDNKKADKCMFTDTSSSSSLKSK